MVTNFKALHFSFMIFLTRCSLTWWKRSS